jgi:hypothetical protein
MSASEAATAIPPVETGGRSEIGAQDLAQGLMLVRASTINMVRLQLAMERRDRRVALQTLDELTLLDRRIGDLLDDLQVDPRDAWPDARRLEHQHRALAAEKLVLAAGASGPDVTAISDHWIDPTPPPPDSAPAAGPAEASTREISPHLIAAGLLLLILAGAVAFLFFTDIGQALIAAPASPEGVSR